MFLFLKEALGASRAPSPAHCVHYNEVTSANGAIIESELSTVRQRRLLANGLERLGISTLRPIRGLFVNSGNF